MAFFSDSGSRRSPLAVSARRSAILSRRLVERTSNRRSAPCAASARATWLPTNPVAPVMKAFMLCFYPEPSEGTLCTHDLLEKQTTNPGSLVSIGSLASLGFSEEPTPALPPGFRCSFPPPPFSPSIYAPRLQSFFL